MFDERRARLLERRAKPAPAKSKRRIRDWHARWRDDEPAASATQWRTRDRYEVVNMADMTDHHLRCATRFALVYEQHASRLAGLLAERARRNNQGS